MRGGGGRCLAPAARRKHKPLCDAWQMEALRLKSSRDGGVFELDQCDGKHWQARLTLPGLRAATEVDGSGYGFGEGLV